jgi:dipeptidyl-peptidase-4
MQIYRLIPSLIAMTLSVGPVLAQKVGPDPEFLQQYAATNRFTLGQPAAIHVTRRGEAVLFLRSGPRSFVRDLYELDVATGKERRLASAEQILGGAEEQLTAEELARRERMRSAARGIASFSVSRDGRLVLVPLSSSLYVLDRASGKSVELASAGGTPIDPQFSPDGSLVSCVRDGDVYLIDLASGAQRRLTQGATATLTHGLAEFVAQEEMSRMSGYWWSADSRYLAYQETDTSDVEEWHIADPARPERAAQPWRYPRAGANNARVRLGVIPAAGGRTTWIDWDRERYPYLAMVTWEENAPLSILVQNRQQTEQLLLAADPATGKTRELLKETDAAWIDLDHNMPHWLTSGEGFLWSSQRSGAWQLELRSRDGRLIASLTPPELGYRQLVGVNEGAGMAYVSASEDPRASHLYRVSLKPGLTTPERMNQHGAVFADDGRASVRITHLPDGEIEHAVYRDDGTSAGKLTSVAERLPLVPNVEYAAVGEEPVLHAALIRPRGFEASQRYPVIVHIYGGPTAQMVSLERRRYLLDQWIADHGFVVVAIDGRGTPARGRAWERAIKGNFIELPLEDQVRGLAALGKKYPELDLARVGIFGWSFGGYASAMAVMQRPDVFHVGVAGAPVVDWADYDTHYTERYLGLPAENPEGYQASSVLTYVSQLRRPLLIVHGTADDNVYFLHSMKLCDALFRAGKPYDFLPLAGFTHMVPDPLITQRLYGRIMDYFVEHLRAPAGRPAR